MRFGIDIYKIGIELEAFHTAIRLGYDYDDGTDTTTFVHCGSNYMEKWFNLYFLRFYFVAETYLFSKRVKW